MLGMLQLGGAVISRPPRARVRLTKRPSLSRTLTVRHSKAMNLPDKSVPMSNDDIDEDEEASRRKNLSLIEVIAEKKKAFKEKQELVATIATGVLSNPQKNIHHLKRLLIQLDEKHDDLVFKASLVKTHTLLACALAEVFKDIIPSYKIREVITEEAGKKRMKKETLELRSFETTLLKLYKMYVNRMERMVNCIRKKKQSTFYDEVALNKESKEQICLVGAKCLCTLLVTHPHFNLRESILDSVIPLMSCKVPEVREVVYEHILRLYREDKAGIISLMAVKVTGKLVKALKLSVHPLVIQSFLGLNIKEVAKPEDKVKANAIRDKMKKLSKKDKKYQKQLKKLQNELLEAEAVENQQKKLEAHTQILNQIFFIYFRFIKDFISLASDDVDSNSKIMTPILHGLSKFAHLLNVDFFDDLLTLLFRLVVSGRLSHLQSIHCLNTVFTLLSGDGSALNIDPQRFYTRLYTALNEFDLEKDDIVDNMQCLTECFDRMLLKRKKQLTLERVMAFCKKLSMVSLQSSPAAIMVYMTLVRILLQDHPPADTLLDEESFGSGKFNPSIEDPEFAHASSTLLWELHSLTRHYDPLVAKAAKFHLLRVKSKSARFDLLNKRPFEVFMDTLSTQDKWTVEKAHTAAPKSKVMRYNLVDNEDSLAQQVMRSLQ